MNISHRNESRPDPLQRRNRELGILNEFAQALNRSVDLPQALNAALALFAELFDLQTGWVWLLDENNNQPYLAAARNLPPGLIENPELMEGSCYCLDNYFAGDMSGAANINVITCSRLKKLVEGTSGLRYHASIPLYAHGKPLGVCNAVSSDWQELSAEDLRLLYTIGDILGIAVERARLFRHSAEVGAVEERNRLAREIHDTLAQQLAGISLQLETAELLIESGAGPERIGESIHQALDLVRHSLEETRRSVLDLRAAPLEGKALADAMIELVGQFNQRGMVAVQVEISGSGQPLPVRVEMGIYRIAQEALNNIEKHSRSTQARLQLVQLPDRITLVIEDHGQGFDMSSDRTGHFGIVGIAERARLLSGSLDLASAPGAGTRLTVSIPVS